MIYTIIIHLYDLSWSYKVICVNFLDRWWSNSDQYIDSVALLLKTGVGCFELLMLRGSTFACGVRKPALIGQLPVGVNIKLDTTRLIIGNVALAKLVLLRKLSFIGACRHITRFVASHELLKVRNRSHLIFIK